MCNNSVLNYLYYTSDVDHLWLMQLESWMHQIEVNQRNMPCWAWAFSQPAYHHTSELSTHTFPSTVASSLPATYIFTITSAYWQPAIAWSKRHCYEHSRRKPNNHALSSSEIDVLIHHTKLTDDITKAGTLATKLACKAVFGTKEQPGLPVAELNELKQIMLQQYPQFWQDVNKFDPVWRKFQCSIEQACKHLRCISY